DDRLGRDALAGDLELLVADEAGAVSVDRDVRVVPVALLDRGRVGLDLAEDPLDDERPVNPLDPGVNAKAMGATNLLNDVGTMDQHLRKDAAAVEASAAERPQLDH